MKSKLLTAAILTPLATVAMIATPAPADAAKRAQGSAQTVWIGYTEAQDLTFLREEEKLARDVYLTLADKWGLAIFTNIARSEQTHMDQVLGLLNAYNLPDPVGGQPVGVFTNVTLQQLYYSLVAQGLASVEGALTVGATIEDLDIDDLDHMMADTTMPDLLQVYENLQKGSRNHLRSFVGQLDALGVGYTPQFISVEAYAAIIGTATETGPAEGSSGQGSSGKGGKPAPRGR